METNARYSLIGLFATLVVVGMFGFVYWIMQADKGTESKLYDVVFSGSVTGLNRGADVLFNGIQVGTVQTLRISQADPTKVVARIQVDKSTPVRTDTKALLSFQGLTGIAFIQLTGGKPDSPPLEPSDNRQVAIIEADKSDFQSILDGAKETIAATSNAMTRLDNFLTTNEPKVTSTLTNLQSFSDALSANADGMETFLASLSDVGQQIGPLADELTVLSHDVRGVVAALDPDTVRKVVGDVSTFTGAVAENTSKVDDVFDSARTAANNLVASTESLQQSLDAVDARIKAVDPETITTAMNRINDVTGVLSSNSAALDTTLKNAAEISTSLRDVVAAVPPEQISTAVSNVTSFTDTLAANDQVVADIIGKANTIADQLNASAQNLNAVIAAVQPETITTAMKQITGFTGVLSNNSATLDTTMKNAAEISQSLRDVVAAVPPEQISTAVGNITSFTDTIAANDQVVADIIGKTNSLADQLNAGAQDLRRTLAAVDTRVGAVDPEAIKTAMTQFGQFMAMVGNNTETVDGAVKNFRGVSNDLKAITGALPPGQFETALKNFVTFTDTVAANNSNIDTVLQNSATISTNLATASAGADETIAEIRKAVAAINADRINRILDNVDSFVASFSDQGEEVDQTISNARLLSEQLNGIATQVETVVAKVDKMVSSDDTSGALNEIGATAKAIRVLAQNLDKRSADISSGITDFTGSGQRDLKALADQGAQTLRRLEEVLTSIQRNPQQFVFGGDSVRDYRR